jgi:hypothetical protein
MRLLSKDNVIYLFEGGRVVFRHSYGISVCALPIHMLKL